MTLNKTLSRFLLLAGLVALSIRPVSAVVIDFTGGTVVRLSGPNQTTNNSVIWDNVDFYEENGFKIDITGNDPFSPGVSQVGDVYGEGNDVVFADLGGVSSLVVNKVDGSSFDLNHFILVSNAALVLDDNDQAVYVADTYIKANGGANDGYTQRLPVDEWGFPGYQIVLGPQFEGITSFEIYSPLFHLTLFSMDEITIDAPPPNSAVPDSGSTSVLFSLALIGFYSLRRRRVRASRGTL